MSKIMGFFKIVGSKLVWVLLAALGAVVALWRLSVAKAKALALAVKGEKARADDAEKAAQRARDLADKERAALAVHEAKVKVVKDILTEKAAVHKAVDNRAAASVAKTGSLSSEINRRARERKAKAKAKEKEKTHE